MIDLSLHAGRELDRLIAETIMGEIVVETDDCNGEDNFWLVRPQIADPTDWPGLPHYSRRITDAWKVVEKMIWGAWYFECSLMGGGTIISAQAAFVRTPLIVSMRDMFGNRFDAICATMPEAICLAALKTQEKS